MYWRETGDWRLDKQSYSLGIIYTDSPFPEDEGRIHRFAYFIDSNERLEKLINAIMEEGSIDWNKHEEIKESLLGLSPLEDIKKSWENSQKPE